MNNLFAISFFIVLSILIFSCKNNTEPVGGSYSVEGIIEGKDGPIQGAKIQIDNKYNWTTNSEEDGSFKINDVSKGDHEIVVTKDYDSSFVERSYTISVEADLILEAMRLPSALTLSNVEIKQTLTSDLITLIWSKSDAEDFREYKLYRHTSSGLDETTGELIHISTFRNDTIFTDSIPHFSKFYYRLYQMNEYSRLGGSNMIEVSSEKYKNEPLVTLNEMNLRYLNQGETLWLYFPAIRGEIYKLTWDHIDWDREFMAEVSCYREDKTNDYFEREVIMPHLSGPKTIIAEANENVYLKIHGQIPSMEGIFRIIIENLNYGDAKAINFDTENKISVGIGESNLFYFNAIADKQYEINLTSSMRESDIYVKITGFQKEMNHIYFNEKLTGSDLDPMSFIISTLNTEPLYIIVTGGYYFYDTSINLMVKEKN